MPKIILSVLAIAAIALYFVMPETFAQSFFGTAPAKKSTDTTTPANTVLSPEDFKNRVRQLDQQTQSNLNQQIKNSPQTFPAQPSQPFTAEQPTAPGAYPSSPPPASASGVTPVSAPPVAVSPTTPAPAAEQTPSQPYTGFGGSGSGTKNSGTTTKSSSSWGVKY